jgi:3-oxoacyl-[acyl-carrier protein] reductase
MDLGLRDRPCVVTGGSRGIGLAIARRLVDEGAHVLVTGRRPDALRDAVAGLGESAHALKLDVTDPDAGDRVLAAAVERFGGLDVLVNNAGGNDIVALPDLTDDDYRAQLEIHVMAPLRLMRAAAPHMAERGFGRIVNIASTSGRRPGSNNLAYAVSKAAELSLSRGYAEHYAARGVLVNAVNPGPIGGELWQADGGLADQIAAARGTTRDQVLDSLAGSLPLGRLGTREEIADVVAFLCSERVGNVVGAAWSADSGAVASIF